MVYGGPPPGAYSRLEVTPGYKGNQPGQYDLLPGQASGRRNGVRHRLRALLARVRRRR